MFITNLMQIGEIYQFLTQNWQEGKARITVKHGKEVVFDNILLDSIVKVNTIYKYLLENWAGKKLQIFYTELDPAKNPMERFKDT